MGADKSADPDGSLVCFADGFAAKNLCHERGCEAVACANRVCNLHLRSLNITLLGFGEDIRADGTAGEDKHLQVVLGNMNGIYKNNEHVLMAGAVLTILPILVVYLISQRYVDQGISLGGLK